MNDLSCPFCKNQLPIETPFPAIVTCARCSRTWNVYQLFWVQKGVKIDQKKQIRCPFCNVLLAEGDYSDREQTFKCRNCKNFCRFQRIDGFPAEEQLIRDQISDTMDMLSDEDRKKAKVVKYG